MARVTAEEAQQKHATRMKNAIGDMQRGIEKITVSPTEQAAQKKDKMIQNLTLSVQDGSWERGLKRVTLDQWRRAIITKGLPRVAVGIDEAKDKMTAFYSELLPYQDTAKQELSRMPDLSLEDSINRQAFWTRRMAAFKRSR